MTKEMFINAHRDECRIAIVSDGALSELHTERTANLSNVGSIYKGRITNVEPSIQAAFVDFGTPKNGFLHISDLHPEYFPKGQNHAEVVGKKLARKDRPPIQKCLQRGQDVIVQVIKDGIGTKGATLTTYLSIPGRYLVLMPGMQRLGVSRKIEDEAARSRMRSVLSELKAPDELGFILRTAGLDRPKRELQRDMHYLMRLWKAVSQRAGEAKPPAELYQESDLVIRTIRDVYNSDIKRIVCDDEDTAIKVKEFFKLTMPRTSNPVELYTGGVGLFHAVGLEQEIENINSATVSLPSGGSLVIEQTEAMVTVDVNSGRLRNTTSAEATALRTNTEAGLEVCRQLRLRDLGGVIVIDFIDMVEEKNRRKIENLLKSELKKDRARSKVLRTSKFGIIEMTRQRVRESLAKSISQACQHCGGTGRVRSQESQALEVMRTVSLAADNANICKIEISVPTVVADHLLNSRRGELARIEKDTSTAIGVHADPDLPPGETVIVCTDQRGAAVHWEPPKAQPTGKAPTREITAADIKAYRARHQAAPDQLEAMAETEETGPEEKPAKKRPSRRGRRRRKPSARNGAPEKEASSDNGEGADKDSPAEEAPAKKKSSRRGRRRRKPAAANSAGDEAANGAAAEQEPNGNVAAEEAPAKKKSSRRGRRRRRPAAAKEGDSAAKEGDSAAKQPDSVAKQPDSAAKEAASGAVTDAEAKPAKKRPSRRGRRRRRPAAEKSEAKGSADQGGE